MIEYSLWAKDLIFVVNDGHVDGMHAWLNAYHGIEQSSMWSLQKKLSDETLIRVMQISRPSL